MATQSLGAGFACSILLTVVFPSISAFLRIPDEDAESWKPVPIRPLDQKETDAQYWREQALHTLHDKIARPLNKNKAKNVIFFLGDGMSVATITAARIYQGQLHNQSGEEGQLFFETFPHTGLSKTYSTDKQVSDSACTATAYMCGVKANFQTIGVSARVQVADCESAKAEANRVSSIVQWAQQAGKATGVVTTTRVTHASPAGSYAHVPYRGMESDQDVVSHKLDPRSCNFDIAQQLVREKPGNDIRVVLGGGQSKFLPKMGSKHGEGERLDGDLVEEWLRDKRSRRATPKYVRNAEELKRVDPATTDYLFGLFAPGHLHYHMENVTEEPRLALMTEKAIEVLRKEQNGFYLFVEGGKIDMAHHEAKARVALDETLELAAAVRRAREMTDERDTLIVVTADHSHTMTLNGYPARGFDILGIYSKANDSLPYTTLSYANGPGYKPEHSNGSRHNIEYDHLDRWDYKYPSMVPKAYESHGGDDVPVYASGPWSHLFSGNYEQNFIPLAEAYAAHIGPAISQPSLHNAATAAKPPASLGLLGYALTLSLALSAFTAITPSILLSFSSRTLV